MSEVKILAIETSCDETAAAVVADGRKVLSNIISTQIPVHTLYGGVVPEIASRKHIERINFCVKKALADADTSLEEIDAVAVTCGPGLVGALLVGVAEAKGIAFAAGKPLIGVHHIDGHISANYIEHPDVKPPFVCLVISGGHTELVRVKDYGSYEVIGKSVDDAAGEAFDKVARAIGLGYPGGPKIEKAALEGDPESIEFPRAKISDRPYDFSFSGMKSAVLNYLNREKMAGRPVEANNIAASFQAAVADVLSQRAALAVREFGVDFLALAGGVASNGALRREIAAACRENGAELVTPSPVLCTDNAAMIGAAAFHRYERGEFADWSLNAVPNLPL